MIIPHINANQSEVVFYLDGELIEQSKLRGRVLLDEGLFTFVSKDTELSRRLLLYKPSDLPFKLEHASFEYKTDDIPFLDRFSLTQKTNEIEDESSPSGVRYARVKSSYALTFTFQPNLAEWNRNYTFVEYCNEFLRYVNYIGLKRIRFETYKDETPFITHLEGIVTVEVLDVTFESVINIWLNTLANVHQSVERTLLPQSQNKSVVLTFDFPDEVKAPCEQYLIYFSQFLRDLGVKATSDLHHEAGQVLFTVTPENPEIALEKIRAALEVYLQLPASPIDAYPDVSTEVGIQRYAANVQHLKGQLSLAKAEIRAAESAIEFKDATIQVLRLTVDEQNRLLSGDISSSIKDVTPRPKDNDKEDLIEGIVSLKTYDAKIADVNIAEIWRRLKKLFKDES